MSSAAKPLGHTFDPQRRPWPRCVHPWPGPHGERPRDMSVGYIETTAGREHVFAGDTIVVDPDGFVSLTPAEWRKGWDH